MRDILLQTAEPVPSVSHERQGAGALAAGPAVSLALHLQHANLPAFSPLPHVSADGITFVLHDHSARQVQLLGSWNDWQSPGLVMEPLAPGVWQAKRPLLPPGRYQYKYLLDNVRWLDDPANRHKAWDGFDGFNSVLDVPQKATE